jgi:hypothetical protein
MRSRHSFLAEPAERRQLAVFRSGAAAAIVAAVIGVGFVASQSPQQAATGSPGGDFGGAMALVTARASAVVAPVAAALAPVDMGAEYQAAVGRARLGATHPPPVATDRTRADGATRKALVMGTPAVF